MVSRSETGDSVLQTNALEQDKRKEVSYPARGGEEAVLSAARLGTLVVALGNVVKGAGGSLVQRGSEEAWCRAIQFLKRPKQCERQHSPRVRLPILRRWALIRDTMAAKTGDEHEVPSTGTIWPCRYTGEMKRP